MDKRLPGKVIKNMNRESYINILYYKYTGQVDKY